MAEPTSNERSLTSEELQLLRWMLINGTPDAKSYLAQLDGARASTWRCPCGCASFNLQGMDDLKGGMRVVADFVYEQDEQAYGIFAFLIDGILAGVEVVGYSADAPKTLPNPGCLRPADHQS